MTAVNPPLRRKPGYSGLDRYSFTQRRMDSGFRRNDRAEWPITNTRLEYPSDKGVAGGKSDAIILFYWPGRGGGIGRHAVLRGQWACACVGSNPALGTTQRSGRLPSRKAAARRQTRRRSQVVKAEVCKTSMRRFESARRLQNPSPSHTPVFSPSPCPCIVLMPS